MGGEQYWYATHSLPSLWGQGHVRTQVFPLTGGGSMGTLAWERWSTLSAWMTLIWWVPMPGVARGTALGAECSQCVCPETVSCSDSHVYTLLLLGNH